MRRLQIMGQTVNGKFQIFEVKPIPLAMNKIGAYTAIKGLFRKDGLSPRVLLFSAF